MVLERWGEHLTILALLVEIYKLNAVQLRNPPY